MLALRFLELDTLKKDLVIFLIYALSRLLTIEQHGPKRHFLIAIMHKSGIKLSKSGINTDKKHLV